MTGPDHHCLWPACPRAVPASQWGCRAHWFRLPKRVRDRIYAAYRVGQGIASASDEYLDAIDEADAWITEHYGFAPHERPSGRPAAAVPK